jgi:GTP-binding protein
MPEGGPYGGDGGKGGDIIIIGDHNDSSLFNLRNKKQVIGFDGDNGMTEKASGKGGKNIYVHVPLGTTVYDSITKKVLMDILESGQKFIVCKGGRGGHGNAFFKSSFNRVPTLHERGDLGEEKTIELKIRYMADVGLIGLPNAGKSTLISQISNAKPKIANYQFTTLTPVLGMTKIKDKELVFEDVPGLIEGASSGKGLGHEFLKHIERCYALIHLISLSPEDNNDIIDAYVTIQNELKEYGKGLENKPIFLVGNKIDVDGYEDNLKILEKKLKVKIFIISAKDKINVDKLLTKIYDEYITILDELKKQLEESKKEEQKDIKVRRKDETDEKGRDIIVKKIRRGVFQVQSEYLKY